MYKGPATGEPETKTVDGVEHKFCHHCKLGKLKKPMWRSGKKAHVTDCRNKKGALGALVGSTATEEEADRGFIPGILTYQGFP